MHITFHTNHIDIRDYIFPICAERRHFTLAVTDIRAVCPERSPPEIILHSDEVIFLDAASRDGLRAFADTHHLPIHQGPDIWALLCEPFLDTELPAHLQENVDAALVEAGFTRQEIKDIRARIGGRMTFCNLWAWEWEHLSHYDVLRWHGLGSPLMNRLFPRGRRQFYDWCNQIALRKP
jgi:hypothetical protein